MDPEIIDFLIKKKKWWLAPIIIALIFFGILIIFGQSSLSSFVYAMA